MLIALTGTPGTGKTSISKILRSKGYKTVGLNSIAESKKFFIGYDNLRESKILDIDSLNTYLKEKHVKTDILIIEGHLSHQLDCVDKIIILRCHPTLLRKRFIIKSWNEEKIKENIEAEILDIILCETIEIHNKKDIFEIDTTDKSLNIVASIIDNLINNNFFDTKNYNIGKIDWSDELLKDSYNLDDKYGSRKSKEKY